MFFRHPETEAALKRMALGVLHDTRMEPCDLGWWQRIKAVLKFAGWELLLSVLLCLVAGARTEAFRNDAWRDFMIAGAVLITTRMSAQRFYWLLQSSPTVNVLWHLPVTGRDICRWGRRVFLLRSLKMLPRLLVAAWAWQGFPTFTAAWPHTLALGALLWIVMITCVMHDGMTHGAGPLVVKAWNLALYTWGMLLIYAWWRDKSHLNAQPLAEWVITLCSTGSWLLPAKWAVHAAQDNTALVLTLLCVLSGIHFWWSFPKRAAITYDRLIGGHDLVTQRITDDAIANDTEEASEAGPTMTSSEILNTIQQASAEETTLKEEGWIEKLTLLLLRGRNRQLGKILGEANAGWTRKWWQAVWICALLLPMGWVLKQFEPSWLSVQSLEALDTWIVILPLVVVAARTLPLSNSIPLATSARLLGQRTMPFFAGLPVSMDDLLHVSRRITIARMGACLLLMLPVIAAQSFILGRADDMLVFYGFAGVLSLLWVAMRPLLICQRLQEKSSSTRRFRPGNFVAGSIIALLCVGIVIAGIACIADLRHSWAWLPAAAGCTQGVYGIFHWRVRKQKMDWVSRSQ